MLKNVCFLRADELAKESQAGEVNSSIGLAALEQDSPMVRQPGPAPAAAATETAASRSALALIKGLRKNADGASAPAPVPVRLALSLVDCGQENAGRGFSTTAHAGRVEEKENESPELLPIGMIEASCGTM